MNSIQNIFNFQTITFTEDEKYFDVMEQPKWKENITLEAFIGQVHRLKNLSGYPEKKLEKYKQLDYWIGVTSRGLLEKEDNEPSGIFFTKGSKERIALITSKDWDRNFSPPSIFEYITFSVLALSLYFLADDYNRNLSSHPDRGFIFDYTDYKPYRRILVSNPILCATCREKLEKVSLSYKSR